MKILPLFLFLVLGASLQADDFHFMGETQLIRPGNSVSIQSRLADVVVRYKTYLPLPRIAFFNVGYPKDQQEYEAMKGYCVLEIIVCTQNLDELPTRNVHISADATAPLTFLFRDRVDNNPDVVVGLGKTREQSYYLVPYWLLHQTGFLFFDFNSARKDFKLAQFPMTDSRNYPTYTGDTAVTNELIPVLKKFISREFEVGFPTEEP